jgi:hypothetical protein
MGSAPDGQVTQMRTRKRKYTPAEREQQRAVRASLDAANQREADANFQGIANALNAIRRIRTQPSPEPPPTADPTTRS